MTEGLLKLESKLRLERKELLLQEELLWQQKSNDWLKPGDRNMKFFHTSTLIRMRKNKIEALINEEGEWWSTEKN